MTPEAQKIEALLFLSDEAVSKRELSKLVEASPLQVDDAIQEISHALAGHGVTLVVTDSHVQLTTSPVVSEYLLQFFQEGEHELSRAATETLALIAYRGPIARYDIDVLRGVDSRRIVRQLVGRGLVRKVYEKGRAPKYEVTEEFLQHLGVTSRNKLPRFEELSSNEKIASLLERSSE